ncbi:hypothetical protein HG530_007003 [Fusarium avenaceum]|nr:hypothetical protein HG530_007003 [Fusarium avenaceum]
MEQHSTTKTDHEVIGSASQPRPGLAHQDKKTRGHNQQEPLTQPIDRSRVRFVKPDTPLLTDWLIGLIFDAYSSRYHARVKIITPLNP